jgi:predicted alpha/beta hydrolase family esterase
VQNDPELAEYDVFSFSYRTTGISGTAINKIAKQLADEISQRLSRYKQVVLITHSMGGLVAMRYILDQLAAGRDLPIRGLLLYGVPINGSHLVTLAKTANVALSFAAPVAGSIFRAIIGSNEQIQQMVPAGEFVQELNDEWALRVVNGGHASEEAKRRAMLPTRVVTGTLDLVVKEVSAKGTYGAIDWHPIDFGHTDLVKPDGLDDVRYGTAKDFLMQCKPRADSGAFIRLREISDKLLASQKRPLCQDWDYEVHLHGNASGASGTRQIDGFSPYIVKRCRYQTTLCCDELFFGFAWGANAVEDVWTRNPIYVHQISTGNMAADEKRQLSQTIDNILDGPDAHIAWSTLFPHIEVAVNYGGKRHVLVTPEIESINNGLVAKYLVPEALKEALNEDVVMDINFSSYCPKKTNSFILWFPWLHNHFKGRLIIREASSAFTVSQFLSGENGLTPKPEYFGHKSEIELVSNDVILPGSHVDISWQSSTPQ